MQLQTTWPNWKGVFCVRTFVLPCVVCCADADHIGTPPGKHWYVVQWSWFSDVQQSVAQHVDLCCIVCDAIYCMLIVCFGQTCAYKRLAVHEDGLPCDNHMLCEFISLSSIIIIMHLQTVSTLTYLAVCKVHSLNFTKYVLMFCWLSN